MFLNKWVLLFVSRAGSSFLSVFVRTPAYLSFLSILRLSSQFHARMKIYLPIDERPILLELLLNFHFWTSGAFSYPSSWLYFQFPPAINLWEDSLLDSHPILCLNVP